MILRALCLAAASFAISLAAHAAAPPPDRVEQDALIYDGIPARDAEADARLGDYLQWRQANFVDWLADGSLLISTRFGNAEQLHRVRGAGGAREQLTFFSEPVRRAAASPYDGDSFIYLQERGDGGTPQLYLHQITDQTTRRLSDGTANNGLPVWANDGKRIAFQSTARDGVHTDIYVTDTTSTTRPRLVTGSGSGTQSFTVQDWSSDDTKLLILGQVSSGESYLYVADVASGTLTLVEPEPPAKPAGRNRGRTVAPPLPHYAISAGRFSRDGRGLYFVSTQGGDFAQLCYIDLYTKEGRSVAPQSNWDVEGLKLSRDGHYLAYTLNDGGTSRLVVHDIRQKADLLLPPLPQGALIGGFGFDREGRQLALSIETAQSPRDVYVLDLADKPVLTRWTQSELGPIDAARLVPAERVSFATWDRVGSEARKIPAFLYRPHTPGPHPVLIDLHDGPASQYRPGWNATTQFLVNELGYVVIAPNVRGSSGYGLSYLALDDGSLRDDAVRDIGSLLVWIGLQNDLDRSHIVAMGGGYGGYLALASLATYSDRFAGGITVDGISNIASFLEQTSPFGRDRLRAEYGDERDPQIRAELQQISPLTHAASIRTPLLVMQGVEASRVPARESEQMVWRIRAGGGEVWYLAASPEGHDVGTKTHRDAYIETAAQFLRRFGRP